MPLARLCVHGDGEDRDHAGWINEGRNECTWRSPCSKCCTIQPAEGSPWDRWTSNVALVHYSWLFVSLTCRQTLTYFSLQPFNSQPLSEVCYPVALISWSGGCCLCHLWTFHFPLSLLSFPPVTSALSASAGSSFIWLYSFNQVSSAKSFLSWIFSSLLVAVEDCFSLLPLESAEWFWTFDLNKNKL